jgi:hypothetical protein
MDSAEKTKPEMMVRTKGIAVETLGLIAGSAVLGAAGAVLIMSAVQGSVETISTVGLLSFFLTSGLSVAAIVLAGVAVALSRTAGRAITGKSEEMSALQTAMIAQIAAAIERSLTTAAIAAGRQEEEHGQPAETAVAAAGAADTAEPEPPVSDERLEKADKKYGEFKDIVLLGIANYPGVIVSKTGEGHYRTDGGELVGGTFVINNEKVAVCTFCTGEAITERFSSEKSDGFIGLLYPLFNEIKRGHLTRVFLVFDSKLMSSSPYAKALNGLSGRIDAETFARFELFEGTPDAIIPELTERVSQLMEEKPEAEEDVPELSFRRQVGA